MPCEIIQSFLNFIVNETVLVSALINTFERVSVRGDRRPVKCSAGVGPQGPTRAKSFAWCQSVWTDTCNIRLADVGHFGGPFIESEKHT